MKSFKKFGRPLTRYDVNKLTVVPYCIHLFEVYPTCVLVFLNTSLTKQISAIARMNENLMAR